MPLVVRNRPPALLTLIFIASACVHSTSQGRLPADCSPMHGGQPDTPAAPPHWIRSAGPSVRSDSALVVIHVRRALDSLSLSDAVVALGNPSATGASAHTDSRGYATVTVPTGRLPLLVLRVGHKRYTDTVEVQPGSRDTLLVGLGTQHICFE